jgi:hypothetical protein
MRPTQTVLLVLHIASLAGCTRSRPVQPMPVSTAAVGQCADPSRAGVVSKRPRLHHANRDLDGDRVPEVVVADRTLCAGANCYWNLFGEDRDAGCRRYLGTVAGSVIDRLVRRGEDGFHDLRGWWQLSSGSRVLLQEYRYRHGGYRIVEAMVCRQEGDDQLYCATDRE